jgi:phosphoribosyl 1,2-cyclic phosphodiesterase
MALYFKSIRSGSGGNCLMLWTDRTTVLIDCGIRSRSRCEALIEEHVGDARRINGVVISHLHHDHLCSPSLQVLVRHGLLIRCHERSLKELKAIDLGKMSGEHLRIRTFSEKPFRIGDFIFQPIPVPHSPGISNFGFVVHCRSNGIRQKVVIMTDLSHWQGLLDHFVGADFIFVESNHDPGLLRKNPNYNSRFHMKNEKTAWLLYHARRRSPSPPKAIMLGHISAKRNTRELILETLETVFRKNGTPCDFTLYVAERDEASPAIRIGD